MEEIKVEKTDKKSSIGPLVVSLQVIVIAVIVVLGCYVHKKSNETAQSLKNIDQSVSRLEDRVNVQIEKLANPNPNKFTSGFGLFSIEFPDGWGDIFRTTNSDLMIIKGNKQPIKKDGLAPVVKDISGDGLEEPYILAIQFYGNLVEPKDATVSDFTIGSGSDKITGKKYVYKYTATGNGRTKGDIDYQYEFPVKNGDQEGELVIFYHVYNSDPTDQVNTVDDIVRSITPRR